jgi:3-hydroxyacyl-CoA dehydrogenase/enoyl-CoA hydratase/3-hydroxybutyryl-CoA epimerase
VTETAFSLTVRDAIARLAFNLPGEPINKITRSVRDELTVLLDRIAADDTIQAAVLLSDKPESFIAGADIEEFVALRNRDDAYQLVRAGQTLASRFETLGKPVVVAIHGACLGGGVEASLACAYRIATDHPMTVLGLPEVRLGIIPAAGGCQRLPRLVGVRPALDLILTGKHLEARRAHRIGLVDEVVHPAILDRVALGVARRLADGWRPTRRRHRLVQLATEKNAAGRRVVFSAARKGILGKTGGHYPAPLAALEVIEHGLRHGFEAGLDMEAAQFAELAVGAVSRNLVRIFFATTALKKDAGVPGAAQELRDITRLGIVGAGFMGAAIAGVAVATARTDVRMRDVDLQQVSRGLLAARGILDERLARRRITKHEHRRLVGLISGGVGWEGFRRAELVIEAVFEDVVVKHAVLREIERNVGPDCVIASNTSTIPIARLGDALDRPERLLGMHFFSPVERMPLLEVIAPERTIPAVTAEAVSLGRKLGKTVIVVRDTPGFWVNRILAPYLNEAGRLVLEGVPIQAVDRAMTRFGFPVGPITLLDEVGLDVAAKASRVMLEAFGERMRPIDGIARMTDEGRLGRKAGRGFFLYEHGKRREVDLAVYEIIGAAADSRVPRDDVTLRPLYAMLNEAARAADEGVVRSPRDGDIGAIFGIGFPPFLGGPLRYLDALGAARVVDVLEGLAGRHGERFVPAPRLRQMAESGARFYSDD